MSTTPIDAMIRMTQEFHPAIPHNRALGLRYDKLAPGEAWARLPYAPHLVGDPDSGVIHGGAITAMMDACSGTAAFLSLEEPTSLATLDLRIDYLKPATPGVTVFAHAVCYKRTRNVAFVRCLAFHERPDDPIASVSATFMLATKAGTRTVDPQAGTPR